MRNELTHEQKRAIVGFLLDNKLKNYGYDQQSWNRIRTQRYRAKARLKMTPIEHLHFEALSGHWTVSDLSQVSYTVGQSQNEELTHAMRVLVDPEAQWQS